MYSRAMPVSSITGRGERDNVVQEGGKGERKQRERERESECKGKKDCMPFLLLEYEGAV